MTQSPASFDLSRALKQLAAATKVVAFYPAQHPTVVSALDKAVHSLRESLGERNTLVVAVGDNGFLIDGKPADGGDPVVAGFAAFLSRRDIGSLTIRPSIDPGALGEFLTVIALDPATLRARGGAARVLAEREPGGISVAELDVAAALRSARTRSPDEEGAPAQAPRTSWSDLLARFLVGQGPMPPGGQHLLARLAGNEKAAWELLTSLQKVTAAAGSGRGAILSAALQRIGTEVAKTGPEALPGLARNLAAAIFALDVPGRIDVLGSSLPLPGANFDLAGALRAHLPEQRLGELIVSMVQSEGNLNARVGTVIRKVLIDRGVEDPQKTGMLDAIRAARAAETPPGAVWDSVEDLISESQDEWISREYKGLLERLGASPPALSESFREELLALPGFSEALTEDGIRRRTWLRFGDLLGIDQDPARRAVALEQIGRRAANLTPGWLTECGEVAEAALECVAAAPAPTPQVREAALRALQAISEAQVRCLRTSFHHLTPDHHAALHRSFAALGEHCVETLLTGLAEEEDWEIRKPFLALLAARGRQAVPALVRNLSDTSWYFVRNVLVILGEIADPSTVPAIALAIDHPEPRVRRDAAAALGRIGGARSIALLKERLKDPDVYEVAMRALAAIDRRGAIGTFLEMTGRVGPFGRDRKRLMEAIQMLGALGGEESVPRLRSILMRGWWLPPAAGDPIRIAAARALEKIGTATAVGAIAQGARSWRHPVRAVCREIAGRRSGAGARRSPTRGGIDA